MYSRFTYMLVVCLLFSCYTFTTEAQSWDFGQAAFGEPILGVTSPIATGRKPIVKVKPIVKCRPVASGFGAVTTFDPGNMRVLPFERKGRWALDAEALFARTKGKVRYLTGAFNTMYNYDDVDINGDMGIPDHAVIPSFSARYRFAPRWSLRYSVMPILSESTGSAGRNFSFGTTQVVAAGSQSKVKWESLYQRAGLVYDALRTYETRVSIVGEYMRVDDRLSFSQGYGGYGNARMDDDLNMIMAGGEYERCLKTMRNYSALSMECKASVAFGDQAFGTDMSTSLKYTISLNNGRWGFLKGGYRYLTYKKKYSDARLMDFCLDGGFIQMGFVF